MSFALYNYKYLTYPQIFNISNFDLNLFFMSCYVFVMDIYNVGR